MIHLKRDRHYGWWTLLILVLLSLLVPATSYLKPHVHRWQMLAALDSTDLTQRELALNYVLRYAPKDERVLHGTVAVLAVEDEANFRQIVSALDNIALWRRKTVGDDPWLRWIEGLSRSSDLDGRIMAGQLTANLVDLADEPRVIALLTQLANDDEVDVRYNALISLAEMIGSANDPQPYFNALATLTADASAPIAEHAWIILALTEPTGGFSANWRTAPPSVARAILWAALDTNPDAPMPAIEALADESTRHAAIYALSFSNTPQAQVALQAIAQTPVDQITLDNHVAIWRSVLAVGDPTAIAAWTALANDSDLVEPIVLSAFYRVGEPVPIDTTGSVRQPLRLLASLEGAKVGTSTVPMTRDMPMLLRALAVRANREVSPAELRPLFESSQATLRDLACVIAAERFGDAELEPMIRALLIDYNDNAKISGSILAGLTGLSTDLLAERLDAEDVWTVATMQRLGLWMAGDDAAMPPANDVAGLLARDDLPKTTILLAMLHRGDYAALDQLLNPRGEPGFDLPHLFDQARWWWVLSRYLPDDAPPVWVWADAELVQFQIQVLRDWYLVNRHRLLKTLDKD